MDASSSCCPQPKLQPPPPMAQVPTPTVVISSPLFPKGLLCNAIIYSSTFFRSLGRSPGVCQYTFGLRMYAALASPPPTAPNRRMRLSVAGNPMLTIPFRHYGRLFDCLAPHVV